jgi:hypothetical protein
MNAAALYASGLCLKRAGERFGVSANAVPDAFVTPASRVARNGADTDAFGDLATVALLSERFRRTTVTSAGALHGEHAAT